MIVVGDSPLNKGLRLTLRRVRSGEKRRGAAENDQVPDEPQDNADAAEDGEDDDIGDHLGARLMLQPVDEHDRHDQGQEERPAVVAGDCREKGGQRRCDQIA